VKQKPWQGNWWMIASEKHQRIIRKLRLITNALMEFFKRVYLKFLLSPFKKKKKKMIMVVTYVV